MASGAKVADNVKHVFDEMKVVKAGAPPEDRIRLVVFSINNNSIDVEGDRIFRQKDLGNTDMHKFFVNLLDTKECRYILYDCHYETTDTPKTELVFMMWCPDTAHVKAKMLYASSKGYLQKIFDVKHTVELHDLSEVVTREEFSKCLGKKMTKLEGHKLKDCS